MRTVRFASLAVGLALAACGAFGPTESGRPGAARPVAAKGGEGGEASDRAHRDLRAERAALLQADAALSAAVASLGLLAGLVPRLTQDADYLQPGEQLIRGREAVRALLAGRPALGSLRFAWRAIRTDVSSDGLIGYTFGYGRYTPAGAGGIPASGLGGYAIAWRRSAAGEWQVAGFLRNNAQADLTAPPAGYESPDYKHYRYFPDTERSAERQAIMDEDARFSDDAAARGLGAAFAAFAAPDAALLAGTFGPEAIGAAQPGPSPNFTPFWRAADADVAATGDLGYTIGTATFTTLTNGVPSVGYTKYLTVWKKQRTGEWKYVFDGGAGSPPPS